MYFSRKHFSLFATVGPLLLVVFSSCERKQRGHALYPIDSLVNVQVAALGGSKAQLTKFAGLGETIDTVLTTPGTSAAWEKELEIFRELDLLNKPVNRTFYLVDDKLFDPGSNLTVKAFTSLEPLPVRSLRVFYDESVLKPRKIEAVYREENSLYASERILSLIFQEIDNKNILTSYSIQGGQKMILSDSVSFSIRGKIQL